MSDMSKTYNPKDVEDKIYERWEKSGFFNPDNLEKAADRFWNADTFSMMMPPPNATGQLHVGHAIMLAIEDMIVRHARMSGKKTLWLPGTDHAAIATQNVVERRILEQEKKTRADIGREELLARIDQFVEETRGHIEQQIRKMGSSTDWSREKFTLSPEMSLAVRTVFKQLYDAGLIYRGSRMVNWCPVCGTTLADDEVEYRDTKSVMYYLRYPLKDSDGYLTVATTRPETMLGDTGVAVNPKDSRYKKYIGKTVMIPLINREAPVIADDQVDREFGTGAVKITPGHDPNDFEMAKRHNLEMIHLYTVDGKIDPQEAADHGFEDFAGLAKDDALNRIVVALKEQDFLEKTAEIQNRVGFCYRSGTRIEPVVSQQWFVSVNGKFKVKNEKFKKLLDLQTETTLKDIMTAAVKSGAVKIVPQRFEKVYFEWMKNLRDWNISRQIWYGHRIPVWYCEDCGETLVAIEAPSTCTRCQSGNLKQDEDTLDTWFSSSLWTFSTLGWPASAKATAGAPAGDLATYHPTDILETGYDILFFWVARMILMTGFALNDIPFRTVYLHGLVRDISGAKMSKSKGNAVNPLEMIEKYGTDALRLSLIAGVTPGGDAKISEQKILASRNFVNKLWNIARFILSAPPLKVRGGGEGLLTLSDRWISERLNAAAAAVAKNFAAHDYGNAAEILWKFTREDLADWYLEIAKIEGGKKDQLEALLGETLKLWHPFAPFVTEHIWSQMSRDLLMVQEYPKAEVGGRKSEVGKKFNLLQNLITGLRNLRAEYRLEPGPVYASYMELARGQEWVTEHTTVIEKLSRTRLNFSAMDTAHKMPYFLWEDTRVFLIIPNFDAKKEAAIAEKQLKAAETQSKKLAIQTKKKDFLKKAPKEIVEKMQEDLAAAEEKARALKTKIKQLR